MTPSRGLQPLGKAAREHSRLMGESLTPVEERELKTRSGHALGHDSIQCSLPTIDDVDVTFGVIWKIRAGTVRTNARIEGLAEVEFHGFGEGGFVRNDGTFDLVGFTGQKPVPVRQKKCPVEWLFSEESR